MSSYQNKQRLRAGMILFALLAQISQNSIAYGLSQFDFTSQEKAETTTAVDRPGIVAILVEEDIFNNSKEYDGLISSYPQALEEKTLSSRIQRYALDVQQAEELTKSVIIKVKKNEPVENIVNTLEKLYLEGDGTPNQPNKLKGIFLVGDVPIPVVNKNGYRFPSLFPYTDFEDKVYIFEPETNDYVPNADAVIKQPEVWHGVLKPPVNAEEGNQYLAIYFDKNHLYHCKNSKCLAAAQDFKLFTKKVLYSDLIQEFQLMNRKGFPNYLRYLSNWEDITYNRFSKYLLQKFVQDSKQKLEPGDKTDNDKDGKIDEDPFNGLDDDGDGEPGSPLLGLADGQDNDSDEQIDEEDEGKFGLCDGSKKIKDCSIPDTPLKSGEFYNVKPGSKYKVADNIDNDSNGVIDEKIDEDNGDAFKGIDNDWDGQIDEDTPQDNDLDKDGKIDEDGSGDQNKDGCSGECGVDEDLDSYDFDSDFYPNGYEKEIGSKVGIANVPTSPVLPFSIPLDWTSGTPVLRTFPAPLSTLWIDEEKAEDDDEDGKIDEDGIQDNDNDKDGKVDEDTAGITGNSGDESTALGTIPDIQTRQLIKNLTGDYFSLFDKFKANVNDWMNSTGRYDPSYKNAANKEKSDVSTFPGLITAKDEFTRNYLRLVNDAVEKKIDSIIENSGDLNAKQLEDPVALIKSSTIKAKVKLEDDSEIEGNLIDFINFSEHAFFDVEANPSQLITDLFIQGKGVKDIGSVQECSLYRGSNGPQGSNSALVESSHLYNVFDPGTNPAYGGCMGSNAAFPERCVKESATLPLFDPLGAREAFNISESEITYQACFDFKEKKRYSEYLAEVTNYKNQLAQFDNEEARKQIPKPGSVYKPADQIVLVDNGSVKVTLQDVLAKFGQGDKIDNDNDGQIDEVDEGIALYGVAPNDTKQLGQRLLMGRDIDNDKIPDAVSFTFKGTPYFLPSIKQVTLFVSPEVAEKQGKPHIISSVNFHKEPTADTIKSQSGIGKSPQNLPIDNPRFISFKDKKGNTKKIKYPNLFAAKSFAGLEQLLTAKEKELQTIAVENNLNLQVQGSLSALIQGAADIYADPAKQNLSVANKIKLQDAYSWKNFTIDDKHQYVLKTYISPLQDGFIADPVKGYESMYLVGHGNATTLEFNFNGDIPEEEEDAEFINAENQHPPNPTAPDNTGQNDTTSGKDNSETKIDGVEVWKWFGEIQKWIKETTERSSASGSAEVCSISDAPGDYYDQILKSGDIDGDGIMDTQDQNPATNDSDKDGIPDGAENTLKLRLTAGKNVLKSGIADTMTITVEGLSANDTIQKSNSFTQVQLTVQNPAKSEVAKIISTNPMALVNGKAIFTLTSTEISGKFSIFAKSTNHSGLISNTLDLESTRRSIRVVSYRKNNVPLYSKEIASGFIIKDQKGTVIAEVHEKTGLITVKDNRFQLIAIPAKGNKPTRLALQHKENKEIAASVFFVASKDQNISIDPMGLNYFDAFAGLQGVHVKDVNFQDGYTIELNPDTAPSDSGSAYLLNKNREKAGIIDRHGNIFIQELQLRLKTAAVNNPVVFEIIDQTGSALFEVYIGAKTPKVQILKPEGIFENFNLAAFFQDTAVLKDQIQNFMKKNTFIAVAATIIPDTDSDGLNDLQELIMSLNLSRADTDGDGITDHEELQQNLHPAKKNQKLFSDLTIKSEGFVEIMELFKRGAVIGYSDGTFKPDQSISREEFLKLNLGAICINCTQFNPKTKEALDTIYNQSPFPDQNFNNSLLYCVKEAKNRQIVSGYKGGINDGFFLPKNSINRAEAIRVILETGRQQAGTAFIFTSYPLEGKPWYYNYVLTAQTQKLFPRGKFFEADTYDAPTFKAWFDQQLKAPKSVLKEWLSGSMTRAEFAIMVANFLKQYDCFQQDQDEDGVPDNYEKYLYGSSVQKADTDGGGMIDLVEILQGKNILSPDDDASSIPEMPILNEDTDQDGLKNQQEEQYGTDQNDPDTDDGGINDGDEIFANKNPLQEEDDKVVLQSEEGIYIVGNNIFENTMYSQQDTKTGEAEELEFLDEIPADGTSKIFIRASLLNEKGEVQDDDSSSIINFSAAENSGAHGKLLYNSVKVKNGIAETELQSTINAGIFKVNTEVQNQNIPGEMKPVFIVPLAPSKIEMLSDYLVMKSGGLSRTTLQVALRDSNNNLTDNSLYQVTLTVSGPAILDESADEDTEKPGVQISTLTGTLEAALASTAETGTITVTAVFEPASDESAQKLTGEIQLTSRDDLQLTLIPEQENIPSDYKAITKLKLQIVDKSNQLISNFQGKAHFNLMDQLYGNLLNNTDQPIMNGTASIVFAAANKSGQAIITANVEGFEPATAVVNVLPKEAKILELETDQATIESNPEATFQIRAKLYDNDHNFAENDSSTFVKFRLTAATQKFANFSGSDTVKVEKGIATITLKSTGLTGPIHIIATGQNLLAGTLRLQSVKKLHAETLKEISPQVLYASLLGADFGNIFEENYFGGWFIFSGKNETAVSLLTTPKPKASLAEVSSNGTIKLFNEDIVTLRVVPHNKSAQPNRFVFTDMESRSDLAEVILKLKPQSQIFTIEHNAPFEPKEEGIYIQQLVDNQNYTLIQNQKGISLVKQGNEVVQINADGNITVLNPDFAITRDKSTDSRFFNLFIQEKAQELTRITFVYYPIRDVKKLDLKTVIDFEKLEPGVYLHPLKEQKNRDYALAFSGNSSAVSKGMLIVDKDNDLPQNQAPGLSYLSLEKAAQNPGIGLTGDNKHFLLFAAGNSVGESNIPYASEIGIVLGDPTIRINNDSTASVATGFTKDIGHEIAAGAEKIQELVAIDYNSDGLKDVMVAYENGTIRLLQNNHSNPRFQDRGIFLSFPNGVVSMAAADFNKDGQEDLFIATKDSCRKGEVCMDIYENHEGNFSRKHLELQPFTSKNQVYMLRTADMNNDGYVDIVTSDDTGTVRIFYNFNGQIDPEGQLIGSLGLKVDPKLNLKNEVLINYGAMPKNQSSSGDDSAFVQLSVPETGNSFSEQDEALAQDIMQKNGPMVEVKIDSVEKKIPLDFLYLDLDPNFGIKSEKRAQDLTFPFNVAAKGDTVEYTLTLSNTGIADIKDMMVSDIVPGNVELQSKSITCLECKNPLKLISTGQSLRPLIISSLSIPAGQSLTLKYQVTLQKTPRVIINVGQNLDKNYPADNYPDISASPEGNTGGRLTYYYSTVKNPVTNKMSYATYVTSSYDSKSPLPPPGSIDSEKLKEDTDKDGIPDEIRKYQEQLEQQQQESANNGQKLDEIGNTVEAGISAFTCGGGCLPMPVNFAFLAPGTINVMGMSGGFDPGLPVFGWGVPSIIPVWPPSPYQGAMGGRIYISPTLTMGLGTGICLGPYLGGICYAFSIPVQNLTDVCEEIAGSVSDTIAKAGEVIQSSGSETAISTNGNVNAGGTGRQASGGFTGSASLGNYQYQASANTNFRIPGFPAVITDWLDRQTEEVVNKLTDLPDIYFIYPDPGSLIAPVTPKDSTKPAINNGFPTATKWSDFRQVLSYMNSLPLVQIETKNIIIKIPALSQEEILRLQQDAKQWVLDTKAEINRARQIWGCDTTAKYQTMCERLAIDGGKLIQSVEKNIEVLEKYKELPRKILAWREAAAKYAYQIICYLDAIVKYTGGYIRKQQTNIEAWVEMIRRVKQTIADWKAMVDLTIEYQASCDKCTSARFTLMELILKLFAAIPSPPVIPFPKLPDIYIDVSQVQTGLKILWPDVHFRPEPIIMPKLSRFTLPDAPSASLSFPQIAVLPDPPDIPGALPDLPPLSLPQLPDIPPPPKVPAFPASIKSTISVLKAIIRILCLLKNGLIPVPEILLKSHIEQLTERPLSPLLPFDKALNTQFPSIEYEYVDQIRITGITNFQLDFGKIADFVENIAEKANTITTDLVKKVNENTEKVSQETQDAAGKASDAIENTVPADIQLNPGQEKRDAQSSMNTLAQIHPELGALALQLFNANQAVQKDVGRYEKFAIQTPDLKLVATQKGIDINDPLFQRPLDDIKAQRRLERLPEFENQKHLAGLRESFIAYYDEQERLMDQFNTTRDLRILAKTVPLQAYLPEKKSAKTIAKSRTFVAEIPESLSIKQSLTQTKSESSKKLEGIALHEFGTDIKTDIKKNLKMIADVSVSDVPETVGTSIPAPANRGIFIINPVTSTKEKLINYVDEADQNSQLLFIDFDQDMDQDIFYTYGGNIYLKENHKFQPVKTFIGDTPPVKELADFEPYAPAINGFKAGIIANKNINMSWKPAPGDIAGYEIALTFAPDQFEQDLKMKKYRVGIMKSMSDNKKQKIPQPKNIQLVPSTFAPFFAESVTGDIFFDGSERTLLNSKNVSLKPGQFLHTLDEAKLVFQHKGQTEEMTFSAHSGFTIPSQYNEGIEIQIKSGNVEIINPQKQVQKQRLSNGMAMEFDQVLTAENGGNAVIRAQNGSYLRINTEESLLIKELTTPETPSVQLELPNGFYYAKIASFNKDGFRSTVSAITLMAPSICSDKQAPFPNGGAIEHEISIFRKLTVNAANSFDREGEITAYWLDTDLNTDSDNDGDMANDQNLGNDLDVKNDFDGDGIVDNDLDDPKFILGPYENLETRKVQLNVRDEAGNISGQEITIKVFVPGIQIAESTASEGIIRGTVDPGESEIPVSIVRDRNGTMKKITTPSANENGKYLTSAQGEITVSDLRLEDSLVIKNQEGIVIGQINPKTGRILLSDPAYKIEVLPAEKPLLPTRIVVKDPQGKVILTLFLVPDINTDTTIDPEDFPYNENTVALFTGVHSKDIQPDDDFIFHKLPADDPVYPGATEILEKQSQKRAAILDTGGNFYVLNSEFTLGLREANDVNDPLVIEMLHQNKPAGELYIAVHSKKGLQTLPADKFKVYVEGVKEKGPLFDSDQDGIPDQWEILYGLNPNEAIDAQKDNDNDGLTNLEEYHANSNPKKSDSDGDGFQDAQELAYGQNPMQKATAPFQDVKPDDPYYQSILNLYQRNILKGIPTGNSMNFEPDENITRAEFTKIMLDLFCIIPRPEAYEQPSAFTDITYNPLNPAWYYAITKEAYFQGLIAGYVGEIDPLTGKSPFRPESTITTAEAVKIILEALEREGALDLSKVPKGNPWYVPYIKVALDMKPYLKQKAQIKKDFILTQEEAKYPNRPMTRAEFIAMADRVLTTYDCSIIDDDNDGMPSLWERKFAFNTLFAGDANMDPDGDLLMNLDEYRHGTDPYNPDTDAGGVNDGQEVKKATNPRNDPKDDPFDTDLDGLTDNAEVNTFKTNPKDPDTDDGGVNDGAEVLFNNTNPLIPQDDKDTDSDGLPDFEEKNTYKTDPKDADTDNGGIKDGIEVNRGTDPLYDQDDLIDPRSDLDEGIYLILEQCLSCPCPVAIEHTADLIPSDIIFGIISSNDEKEIFSKSNKIKIFTLP